MEMKQNYIDAFEDLENSLMFHGCYAFMKSGKALLLGNSGNMILVSEGIYHNITDNKMNDDLWLKLLQRKFAVHKNRDDILCSDDSQVRPTYFMIDMTNQCNMGCRYCLRDTGKRLDTKIIKEETIIQICKYIAEYCRKNDLGQIFIQPWGGEPLLEKEKIYLIQDEMEKSGIKANITLETNGLLLTEQIIKELYDRKIGYGISIDGVACVHDGQRTFSNGAGTHKFVEQAVKKTREIYGDDMSVLATVTRQSVPYIGKIVDYFAKELKLKKIKVNFVHKSVFQQEDEFCVDGKDIKTGIQQLFDHLVMLNENGIEVMEYNVWVKMMNILTNRKMDACISRGCNGGKSMVAFDTEGNIYPCDVTDFPDENIGSIRDGKDLDMLIAEAMETKSYFTNKESDACSNCPWKHFCGGGCTVHVKCAGKKAGSIDEIECAANKALYPKIIEIILEKPALVNQMLGYEIL